MGCGHKEVRGHGCFAICGEAFYDEIYLCSSCLRIELDKALDIISDLSSEEDCWFDHHGNCQEHGWFNLTDGNCPQKEAKEMLKRYGRRK